MGSVASITLYADSPEQARQAFAAAFRRIRELDRILSDYDSASALSNACASGAKPNELLAVVRFAQALAAETEGAFDITAGPLTALWRTARREKRVPDPAEIAAARALTGFRKLNVEGEQILCGAQGMRLDAGGIAKGYAGDEALKVLSRAGIRSALVAMSGDIVAGDAPPGKTGWRVGVGAHTLMLSNAAVSTSGDEFQSLRIGGERYSHVIDPRTGEALRNSPTVSVVAQTGIEADAISTAANVMGPEAARALQSSRKVQMIFH